MASLIHINYRFYSPKGGLKWLQTCMSITLICSQSYLKITNHPQFSESELTQAAEKKHAAITDIRFN